MNGFRERVADAFRRDAGYFRDGHVYEPPFVGIERTHLLVDTGLLRLLGEEHRHLPKFDVFAFAVAERVDEDALIAFVSAAESHVDDVLKRFYRLAAVARQKLRLFPAQIQPWTIRRLLHVNRRVETERRGE